MKFISDYSLFIAFLGCMLYSTGLHYKKEGKNIKYGPLLGFSDNLNKKGKALFFVGIAMVVIGVVKSTH